MSKSWRSKSIKIFLGLFFACVLLFAFTFVSSTQYTAQSIVDTYNVTIGESLFEGDSILGVHDPIEVPFLSNMGFIDNLSESIVYILIFLIVPLKG